MRICAHARLSSRSFSTATKRALSCAFEDFTRNTFGACRRRPRPAWPPGGWCCARGNGGCCSNACSFSGRRCRRVSCQQLHLRNICRSQQICFVRGHPHRALHHALDSVPHLEVGGGGNENEKRVGERTEVLSRFQPKPRQILALCGKPCRTRGRNKKLCIFATQIYPKSRF